MKLCSEELYPHSAIKRLARLVVRALDSQSRGPAFKTTGCLKDWHSLSSSEIDQVSSMTSCGLSRKK